MAALPNARHERYAQGLAEGLSADAAYEVAGFKANRGNAARLKANENIERRVAELVAERKEKVLDRFVGLRERAIKELARIGFADIRKAVTWHGSLIQEKDNPDGGDVLVIKNTYSNHVSLVSSEDLDDDTAAAIAEVSQSPTGGLKIKLHDKRAALVAMLDELDADDGEGEGSGAGTEEAPEPDRDHLASIAARFVRGGLKVIEGGASGGPPKAADSAPGGKREAMRRKSAGGKGK